VQADYRRTTHELERRAIGVEFERLVRSGAARRSGSALWREAEDNVLFRAWMDKRPWLEFSFGYSDLSGRRIRGNRGAWLLGVYDEPERGYYETRVSLGEANTIARRGWRYNGANARFHYTDRPDARYHALDNDELAALQEVFQEQIHRLAVMPERIGAEAAKLRARGSQ
jgi:hypothetical protein